MKEQETILQKSLRLLKSRWQRTFNTIAIWFVLTITMANQTGLINLGNQVTQLEHQLVREREEISQLVIDEGFRKCSYEDSRGKGTIGFGHLIKPGEDFSKCITPTQAINLLRTDYNSAKNSVEKNYPWAKSEVRLVLINMTYQMGAKGVSGFKEAVLALKSENYDRAAAQMLTSNWEVQTKSRAVRLAGRIMNLNSK